MFTLYRSQLLKTVQTATTPVKRTSVPLTVEDVPLVEFMYLVFTRMPGESYPIRLGSLLLNLCYVLRALITSSVC